MVVCKICEKEVPADKLGPHSQKCKDLAESKELLSCIIAKMEAHGEQASEMKHALETNAAKQKKKQTKKNSSKELTESGVVDMQKCSIFSENGSTSQTQGPLLTDIEQCNSEEDRPERIVTTRDTLDNIEDTPSSVIRMSEEDYRKFVEEVNKSMVVLKKIVMYAQQIANWALETTSVCNVGRNTQSELIEDEKELVDENVMKFLKEFRKDLESYFTIREKYLGASHELVKLSSPDAYVDLKQKFFTNRSTSSAILKFKANRGKKSSFSKKPEETVSAVNNAKGSPAVEPVSISNVTVAASPGLKSMKTDFSKMLLQNNANHVQGNHVPHIPVIGQKKNPEDGKNLKEKIKATLYLNTVEKSPVITGNVITSPKSSGLRLQKDNKSSTEKMTLAPNSVLSSFAKNKSETKTPAKDGPAPKAQTPTNRSSQTLFKTLRNEDVKVLRTFNFEEEQRNNRTGTPKLNEPIITITPAQQLKAKKLDEDPEFVVSLRGYYSDRGPSRSRRHVSSQESDPHNVTFEDFETVKFLGQGAYGEVWLVKKKATGDHYAMKTVDWSNKATQDKLKDIKAEKDIYQALEGDFVVKAFWTFHHENLICFVTEYMLGGDFDSLLDRLGRLEEDQARFYFAELVLAVESLHNLKVVHRDLKPDNIMMDAKGHIRLTDFGLSKGAMDKYKSALTPAKKVSILSPKTEDLLFKTSSNKSNPQKSKVVFSFLELDENPNLIEKKCVLTRSKSPISCDKKPKMVGTPDYMAPEIIAPEKYDLEGYDEKCMDWWSMGVILYQFLVGMPAFCDTSIEGVFDNIMNHRMEWPPIGDDEDCISYAAADLIRKLLNSDPRKRLGAKGASEVKNHPFFKGVDWATLREREAPIIPCSMENEQADSQQSLNESPDLAKSVTVVKRNRAKTAKPIDFGAFKMRRLDLLHEANQKIHKDFQRQNSSQTEI